MQNRIRVEEPAYKQLESNKFKAFAEGCPHKPLHEMGFHGCGCSTRHDKCSKETCAFWYAMHFNK